MGKLIVGDSKPPEPAVLIVTGPEGLVVSPQASGPPGPLPVRDDVTYLRGEIGRQRIPLAVEHRSQLAASPLIDGREEPVERVAEQADAVIE